MLGYIALTVVLSLASAAVWWPMCFPKHLVVRAAVALFDEVPIVQFDHGGLV